jgi:hypothetical protein
VNEQATLDMTDAGALLFVAGLFFIRRPPRPAQLAD